MDLIGDMMITYSDDDHDSNYKSTGNGCNDKEGDHDIDIDHIDSSSFLLFFSSLTHPYFNIFHSFFLNFRLHQLVSRYNDVDPGEHRCRISNSNFNY